MTSGSAGAGRGTEYATPGQKGKEWTRGQAKEAKRVIRSEIASLIDESNDQILSRRK